MPNGRVLPEGRWEAARSELRGARERCGVTVEALASLLEVSPKGLYEVLRPRGRVPSRTLFFDLCFALRTPAAAEVMLPDGWRLLCPTEAADLERYRHQIAKAEVVICVLVAALEAAGLPLPEGLDTGLR